MEKLCLLLNCTPNALFEWREDNKTVVPEGHALHSLNKENATKSFTQAIRDIPSDKLEKLGEILAELKEDTP